MSEAVTSVKYIINLATKHKIKDRLCTSEGLAKIYNLLGNNKLTRCLSYSNDAQLNGEKEWLKLIQESSENLSVKEFYSKKENIDIAL